MLIYLLYIILSPLLWVILFFVSLINIKVGRHWKNQKHTIRNTKQKIKDSCNNRKIVLFHAASSGEFEQIKPILELMDKKKYFVIISFFSPTIYEKENNNELADAVCYHPFDFPWSALSFFKSLNLDYYIITRHDIWPTHILFAKILKIKSILINANLHNNSFWLKFNLCHFNKQVFSKFDKILTGSERLKKNLKLIVGDKMVICTGDSRFDQVKIRMKNVQMNHFSEDIHKTKNILLGSIDKSDLKVLIEGMKLAYPNGDKSLFNYKHRIIIVPHEIDESTLALIELNFRKLQLNIVRYTQMENKLPNTILIDKIGVLADLYGYAEIAYVGAGFGAGVHSVIEPAVYGCVVSFGPNIQLLDEAVEMTEKNIGIIIKNITDFYQFLKLLNKDDKRKKIQSKTHLFVKNKYRSSPLIINEIFKGE